MVLIVQRLLLQNLINLRGHEPKTTPERDRSVEGDEARRPKALSDSKGLVNALLRKARFPKLRQNGEIMDVVLLRVRGISPSKLSRDEGWRRRMGSEMA